MNHFSAAGAILICLATACEAQIQVNVYNVVGVSDHALGLAQEQASRILREAGVSLSWCHRIVPGKPCATPGPTTIQVQLYSPGKEGKFNAEANALGFALTSPTPEFGFFVGVFTERIANHGQTTGRNFGLVLGHVIAHEIGHLLLERSVHARSGLMKADWGTPERNLMAMGRLLFSSDEGRQLRNNVKARLVVEGRASDGF